MFKVKPLIIAAALITSTFAPVLSGMTVNASDTDTEVAAEVSTIMAKVAPQGVTIEGVDIGGMSEAEAETVVKDYLSKYNDVSFTLVASGEEMVTSGKELNIIPVDSEVAKKAVGYGSNGNILERYVARKELSQGNKKDFSISLTSDWDKTKAFLEENTKSLASAPVDNSIVRENGGFRFVEGKAGFVVDCEASATEVCDYITENWSGEDAKIELAVKEQEPKGSYEELSQVKDLLGSFNTDFHTSGAGRAANVKNGTSKLNGKLIYPGEVFSVSDNLEKRNAENGYHLAASYENGTTVDTYGGGVCQISTTLYNAIIRAELEITERYPHSMIVSYVKPSMDAAISEGSKDLKFKNNKNYPVYIEGYTSGGVLYFNIFGKEERPSGRKVSFESEVLSTNEPEDKYNLNPSLPVGTFVREQSAHVGHSAKLWKVVTENGKTDKTMFNQSTYRASPAIYTIGTKSDNPSAVAAIQAALATKDRTVIKNTAAAWANGAVPPDQNPAEGDPSAGPEGTPTTNPTPEANPTPAPTPTPTPTPETNPESDPAGGSAPDSEGE